MPALRIAQIDPAAYSLPYDVALCEALARDGHEVTLFTTRFAHGPMPEVTGARLVTWFYRLRLPLPRRLARALQHPLDMLRLRRRLRRDQFDIVHVQWLVHGRFDRWVWRRVARRTPVVFTAHNAVRTIDADAHDIEELCTTFSAIVVHSATAKQRVRSSDNVWHVPHGVLTQYAQRPNIAPPIDINDGPLVALPGLLRPYKGLDVLLECWPAVRAQVPNAQLLVAGRPMGVTIPDTLPDGVSVLPRFLDDDEFAWVLHRADVVVLPYRSIDMSGVLYASMAAARPMVLTRVGGFAELEGAGADLVPAGDAPQLAAALVHVLTDTEHREALAQQAQEAARTTYSWAGIAREYSRRYTALIDGNGSHTAPARVPAQVR